MDPSTILRIIGNIFFHHGVLTIIFLAVYGAAAVIGFRRPVVAIALYFSSSIINPQTSASLFYSIPMAKLAAGIAMVSLMINQDQVRIFFPKQFFVLILFILFANLSFFAAEDMGLAAKRQSEFNKIALVCFLTVWVVLKREDYKLLFYTTVFSFYYNVLKNLVETQTKGRWYAVKGTGGWIGDSNDWALALAMAIPLFYVAVICSKKLKERLFHIGAALSSLMVLTITSSRGGFLGAAAATLVLLLTERHKIRMVAVGAVLIAILSVYAPDSYVNQIRSIFDASDTAEDAWTGEENPHEGTEYTGAERVWNWRLAYMMMQDHPFSGVGWGNYVRARAHYEINPGDTVTHSTWFQVGAEAGFTGLITFMLMILTAFFSLLVTWWRARQIGDSWLSLHARALMAGLVAFCVAGSFVSREYSDLLFLYFCFAVILPKFLRDEVARELLLERYKKRHGIQGEVANAQG